MCSVYLNRRIAANVYCVMCSVYLNRGIAANVYFVMFERMYNLSNVKLLLCTSLHRK